MASVPAVLHDGISTLKMKIYMKKMYIITTVDLPPPFFLFFFRKIMQPFLYIYFLKLIMQPTLNSIGPSIRIGRENSRMRDFFIF